MNDLNRLLPLRDNRVISRRGGYEYQSEVGVLRLIDILAKRAEYVVLEATGHAKDKFDDIKVYAGKSIHHYQVKWGMTLESHLETGEFVNASGKLYLPNLYDAWRGLHSKETQHYVHIYTNKPFDSADNLETFLSPADSQASRFVDAGKAFRFNDLVWSDPVFSDILKIIAEKASRSDIDQFLRFLVIEIEQPSMKIDDTSSDGQNDIQSLASQRIGVVLGLDKPPNNRNPTDIHSAMLEICNKAAISGQRITFNLLASQMNIYTDFAPIPQDFEFDESEYLVTSANINELSNRIRSSSGKIVMVTGRPGAGKSWLLTHWIRQQRKDNASSPAIGYYCFTKVSGDENEEIRITKQQLIQNLIHEIFYRYPELGKEDESDVLAATEEKLSALFARLGNLATSRGVVVPVLIDGLDHIHRIRSRSMRLRRSDIDIMAFLENVKIPIGVCIIVGTQPIDYISRLESKHQVTQIRLNGFSKEESKTYLARHSISEDIGVPGHVIDELLKKTDGLPLLLSYAVRSLQGEITKESVTKMIGHFAITGGDVHKYYEMLWQEFASPVPARQCARFLSLLDFPAPNDMIEASFPPEERLDDPLESIFKQLMPLLKRVSEGITFFHESFRSFVLNDLTFTRDIKVRFYRRLYEYLNSLGILENDLSFKKGLEYAYLGGMYDNVLQTVSVNFIDEAIKRLFFEEDILANITLAVDAAVQQNSLKDIVRNNLLKKYTKDRFELILPFGDITRWLIEAGRAEYVIRHVMKNTERLHEGTLVDMLSVCIDYDLKLPYKELFEVLQSKIEYTGMPANATIMVQRYAKVLTYLAGLPVALKWIKDNENNGTEFGEDILSTIGMYSSSQDILFLLEKEELSIYEGVIAIAGLSKIDDKKRLSELFTMLLQKRPELKRNPLVVQKAIDSGISPESLKPLMHIFIPEQPSGFPNEKEIGDLNTLERIATALSYCGKNDILEQMRVAIQRYPLTSARILQEMCLELSAIKGKILLGKQEENDASGLLSLFERFLRHTTQLGLNPRDMDCVQLRPQARRILESIVATYLEISKTPDLSLLFRIITRLNGKFSWRMSGMAWDFISREESLACLAVLARKFPDNQEVLSEVKKIVESLDLEPSTSIRIDLLLARSEIMRKSGMKAEAEAYFNRAITVSHAYGFHKDMLLDALNGISSNLNRTSREGALRREYDILNLTTYLWGITDHDETRYIPGNISEEVMKLNTAAGIRLAKYFHETDFPLAYRQSLEGAVKNLKNAPVAMRFLLTELLNHNRYDSYWPAELKLDLVEEALTSNQIENSIFMIDRTRRFLKGLDHVDRRSALRFNELADRLRVEKITVPAEDDTFSFRKKKTIWRPRTSLKDVAESYRFLTHEEKMEVEDDVVENLQQFVKNLKIDELEELISFVTEEPLLEHKSANLLRGVAERYKNLGSEKWLEIQIKSFEVGYGWLYGWGEDKVSWLVSPYQENPVITNKLLLESFVRFTVRGSWAPEILQRMSEYFAMTSQKELLSILYTTVYEFCLTLFRDYDPLPDEYGWLKEFNEIGPSEEETIIQLFGEDHKIGKDSIPALRSISARKDLREFSQLLIYEIINHYLEKSNDQ